MAISVVNVRHNDGFLPDIITVDPMLLPSSGNPFKCHEEILSMQPMIPPKRFDIFPPDWRMLRKFRWVLQIFLETVTCQVIVTNVLNPSNQGILPLGTMSLGTAY